MSASKKEYSMTTNTSNLPISWEDRINQFSKIIGLTEAQVESALAEKPLELTKETPYVLEMLSDDSIVPFGDLRKIFSDDRNVSLPKLRLGVKYLRGPKEVRDIGTEEVDPDLVELQTKYGIKTRFEDLGAEDLIPCYNPSKQNRITKALQAIFGDKPVIAFKPDSKQIAIEETINYIIDINDGLPEEDAIEVNGELVQLYPIGKLPNQTIDEDPLFEGQPLKRNRSIVNRFNWDGISKEIRQMARILVNRNDIDANDRMKIRSLFDSSTTMGTIKKIFPEAYMQFKQLSRTDELPKLILTMDQAISKNNNPFGINRKY